VLKKNQDQEVQRLFTHGRSAVSGNVGVYPEKLLCFSDIRLIILKAYVSPFLNITVCYYIGHTFLQVRQSLIIRAIVCIGKPAHSWPDFAWMTIRFCPLNNERIS
jgi:hypothetical protein